jgi:CDP-glycerol glycerophosphotransferase
MLKNLIKIFLLYLKKLIPKKKILVFGDRAGRRFADNSRYLFIYLSEFRKDYKCVWITSDIKIKDYLIKKNYICCTPFSLKGIYYILSAKYNLYNFVEDDINRFFTELSDSIHLWHGVLPKKLKEIKTKETKLNNFFYKKVKKYFLYPNKEMSLNIFNRFPKNKYQLKIYNLPRNIIFDKKLKNSNIFRTDGEIIFREKILKSKKKIFGYFPTWRPDGLELFRDVKDLTKLDEINIILKKTNSLMIIKKHMNSDKKDKNILYNNKIEELINHLQSLESFVFADYDFDLNSILDVCDILITDYSGVIFDFLYLDRPIITYAPDYEKFKSNTGFILDPTKNDFTFYVNNFDQLKNLIFNFETNNNNFKNTHFKNRSIIKDRVFLKNSGIKEIVEFIDSKAS